MTDPAITNDLIAAHGLSARTNTSVSCRSLGVTPSFTELGIFSAMWNEHCSYKSSKKWLRTLPTEGPQVICGPGENAGIVDIGDGPVGKKLVVFKMESHNHPSYIEPTQGAATGVGGILRDVFTMGARPVAAMNALSFGEKDHPKTRSRWCTAWLRGSAATATASACRPSVARRGFTRPITAIASSMPSPPDWWRRTGSSTPPRPASACRWSISAPRRGVTALAGRPWPRAEFDDTIEEKRPTVQVGDPFTEKRLLEACLELMATGAVISIQDMGAAGLTCSAVEMGDKGGLGIQLTLDHVPQREDAMTAYEMMLSESQERMLMVLRPEKEAEARAVFEKWDLDFAIVGETIPEDRFVIVHGNETVADLPLSKLSSEAPEYDRPWVESPPAPEMEPGGGGRSGRRAENADRLTELLFARLDLRTI
jgi:phosphoribosylformylglycinamidine (FGAM) synthase-like enzyme